VGGRDGAIDLGGTREGDGAKRFGGGRVGDGEHLAGFAL
jgi:hypothetical protein